MSMTRPNQAAAESLSLSAAEQIGRICDLFEGEWKAGQRPQLEALLKNVPAEIHEELLQELLRLDIHYRVLQGETPAAAKGSPENPCQQDQGCPVELSTTLEGPDMLSQEEALMDYLGAIEEGRLDVVGDLLARHPNLGEQARVFQADEAQLDRLFAPLSPNFANRELFLPAGTRVNDYEILEYLACGGMGVVYRAWQSRPEREVALKMVRRRAKGPLEDVDGRTQACHRLLFSEAGHAARLDHPHIVPIYEVGEYKGEPYFSMKLVEGGSLAQLPPGLADDSKQVARLLATIARAVHHAHQRGVLHRDLKPANILLRKEVAGKSETPFFPLVSDFGLAQQLGALSEGAAGTLPYMAPEQLRGDKELSVAVDVYGLGAILYELLTGRPPMRNQSKEVVPPRTFWRRVPADLEAICLHCLKDDPEKRYGSAEEVARDLDRFVQRKPVRARPRSAVGVAGLWVLRQPALAAFLAALLVLVCLGISYRVQVGKAADEQDKRERALYVSIIHQASAALADGQPTYANDILDKCPVKLRGFEYYCLRRACLRQVLTLVGHTGQVLRVQYSPDSRYMATESEDGTVKLWDAGSRKLLHELPAALACFSCDSRLLLIVDHQGRVQQREIEEWQRVRALDEPVLHQRPRLVAARGAPWAACLDRTANEQVLYYWQLGQPPKPLPVSSVGQRREVNDIAISPDGRYVAAGGSAGLLMVWDLSTGQQREFKLPEWAGWPYVWALAFSGDSRYLATGLVRPIVWDVATGEPLPTPYSGTGELTCYSLAFGANNLLAAAYRDGYVRVWDRDTRRAILAPPPYHLAVPSVAFSPDGKHLAWARGREVVIETLNRAASPTDRQLEGHQVQPLWSVAFSPDANMVASRSMKEVMLWSRDGELLWQKKLDLGRFSATEAPVCFSPDGRWVVTATHDQLQAWDVKTEEMKPLPGPSDNNHIRWHAIGQGDGEWLLAVSDGTNRVQVWSVDATLSVATRKFKLDDAGVGEVYGLAFPSGERNRPMTSSGMARLAVCGSKGMRIYNLSGSSSRSSSSIICQGLKDAVLSVTFSPDGLRLATGGVSGKVCLWDAATGRELFTLTGHAGNVAGVAFCPKGPGGQREEGSSSTPLLASCSVDGRIKLWDCHTGQEVLSLDGHKSYVTGVAFSSDGLFLASCGHDGYVRLWDGRPTPE
jgi:eukaryotic-like serine/threonine-protein kinase